ncbi:MAG: carboxypeptidase-like regulatory domain-containing protein [Bryobacteraceae bacterium]
MRLLLPSAIILAGLAGAQATNNNPANTPDVLLDNHRPLVKKKDKAPTSRDVSGKVVDISGRPIEGALVTLTNTKTNSKVTFVTKNDGRYNFGDLSFTIDYQLQAKYKDASTELRKISQYDRNPSVVRILELDDSAKPSARADEAKREDVKK